MAESRIKIRAIGVPFDPQYSSCSNIKPKDFDWSIESGEIDVHIDRGMMINPHKNTPKEKRFGWVCESRFIVMDVYEFLVAHHKQLFEQHFSKIFTCDKTLLNLHPNFVYCPNGSNFPWVPKDQWKIYPKTKLCSMFCSPKRMTLGQEYRHKIAKVAIDMGFDVFGGAHGTPRTVLDPQNPWNTKLDGVKDYMFSIVMENGIYDDYWTEKITDCFATGTIPVYWGSPSIGKHFNMDGIIVFDYSFDMNILTKETYVSKIDTLKDNLERVKNLSVSDDILFGNISEKKFKDDSLLGVYKTKP